MAGDWTLECEELVRSVEQLGAELGALAGEVRKAALAQAEAQARALVELYVPVERRDEAWRMVQRGERVAGQVADWAAQQGPWALAWRLWPEVKGAVEDTLRGVRGHDPPAPSS